MREETDSGEWFTLPDFSKDGSIDETVLYDDNGVKIIANSIEYGDIVNVKSFALTIC